MRTTRSSNENWTNIHRTCRRWVMLLNSNIRCVFRCQLVLDAKTYNLLHCLSLRDPALKQSIRNTLHTNYKPLRMLIAGAILQVTNDRPCSHFVNHIALNEVLMTCLKLHSQWSQRCASLDRCRCRSFVTQRCNAVKHKSRACHDRRNVEWCL